MIMGFQLKSFAALVEHTIVQQQVHTSLKCGLCLSAEENKRELSVARISHAHKREALAT